MHERCPVRHRRHISGNFVHALNVVQALNVVHALNVGHALSRAPALNVVQGHLLAHAHR